MEEAVGVLIEYRTIFVALLIWIIMYALLITRGPFKDADSRLNAGIAALAAIIVSLSAVVAFAVSYLFSFFGILIVAIFVIAMLLNFLEIDIPSLGMNGKIVSIIFIVLFLGILINSFFAMNNEFSGESFNEEEFNSSVDTTANIGFGEVETDASVSDNWLVNAYNEVPASTWSAVLFLVIIGVFVIFFSK